MKPIVKEKPMKRIEEFYGEYRWLSNFWPAEINVNGWVFTTNEHAYQAAKSLDQHDWTMIQGLKLAGEAKRFGSKLTLRPDWDQIKLDVMRELTALKYDQHATLRNKLMDTKGIELIEGNNWNDTFWGVSRGVGQNWLGRIIMEYRDR
jgi:ribA/ribD-fused uncharacterized protein